MGPKVKECLVIDGLPESASSCTVRDASGASKCSNRYVAAIFTADNRLESYVNCGPREMCLLLLSLAGAVRTLVRQSSKYEQPEEFLFDLAGFLLRELTVETEEEAIF